MIVQHFDFQQLENICTLNITKIVTSNNMKYLNVSDIKIYKPKFLLQALYIEFEEYLSKNHSLTIEFMVRFFKDRNKTLEELYSQDKILDVEYQKIMNRHQTMFGKISESESIILNIKSSIEKSKTSIKNSNLLEYKNQDNIIVNEMEKLIQLYDGIPKLDLDGHEPIEKLKIIINKKGEILAESEAKKKRQ